MNLSAFWMVFLTWSHIRSGKDSWIILNPNFDWFARLYRHALVELAGMFRFGSATQQMWAITHNREMSCFLWLLWLLWVDDSRFVAFCLNHFALKVWPSRPPNKKKDTPKSSGKNHIKTFSLDETKTVNAKTDGKDVTWLLQGLESCAFYTT